MNNGVVNFCVTLSFSTVKYYSGREERIVFIVSNHRAVLQYSSFFILSSFVSDFFFYPFIILITPFSHVLLLSRSLSLSLHGTFLLTLPLIIQPHLYESIYTRGIVALPEDANFQLNTTAPMTAAGTRTNKAMAEEAGDDVLLLSATSTLALVLVLHAPVSISQVNPLPQSLSVKQ